MARDVVDVYLHDRTVLRFDRGMSDVRALLDRTLESDRAGVDCHVIAPGGDLSRRRVRFLDRDAVVLIVELLADERRAHQQAVSL